MCSIYILVSTAQEHLSTISYYDVYLILDLISKSQL